MSDENTTPSLPGERLREQRERRGLTLAQASSELHIDQRMLGALEADDYATLGAPIFVKGHLRSYAKLLGLDAAELIAQYEAATEPAAPELVAHRPDGPRMDSHRSQAWVGWFGWLFLLLLGLLLAGWWYYQQEGGADFSVAKTPERVSVPATQREQPPVEAVENEPVVEEASPDEALLGEASPPATTEAPAGDATTPASPAQSRGQEDATTTQPQAQSQPVIQSPPQRPASRSAAPAAGRGLVLEFSEESWVEIYDAEGRPILYDLLAPGTRREISASGQLRVFLGNAAGVEVEVGGEEFDVGRYRRADNTARFTVNVPASEQP